MAEDQCIGLPPQLTDDLPILQRLKRNAWTLQKQQFYDNEGYKWKIFEFSPRSNRSTSEAIILLEQITASMIRLSFQTQEFYRSKFGTRYQKILWFGAENVAVTTHYLHQLAKLSCIHTVSKNSPKHVDDLVPELLNLVSNSGRILMIFSNPENHKELDSLKEIHPFVPTEANLYNRTDFLVITHKPQNFATIPLSSRHKAMIRMYKHGIAEEKPDYMNKLDHPITELFEVRDLYCLFSLLELLYPKNLTKEFLNAFIGFNWRTNDSMKTSMLAAVDYLISSGFMLPVGGFLPTAYCHLKVLEYVQRHEKYSLGRIETIKILARGLNDFFKLVFDTIRKDEALHLFSDMPNVGGNGCLVTEAAMHQSWLLSVAQENGLQAPSTKLLDLVVEYINTKAVGAIYIRHRQELLGEGNYEVRKGFIKPRGHKKEVAVKCIPNKDFKTLDREISALLELESPYIVRYFQQESDGDFTYIAMELCDETLEQWVTNQGQQNFDEGLHDLPQRFKFLKDAALGLAYLHSVTEKKKAIRHRDIKPANILFKTEGSIITAKIADFGLSKPVLEVGAKTTTSGAVGTLAYMAPETILHGETSLESDMYAFGKVCCFVLSCGTDPPRSFDKIKKYISKFDFYGVSQALQDLASEEPSNRITAAKLLEHPMFWISEEQQLRFTNFIFNLSVDFGVQGTPFHAELSKIQLDWKDELMKQYENVEEVIDYYPGAKPGKPGQNSLPQDAAGYLRFCRNSLAHATEHRDKKLQFVIDHYIDKSSSKPDRWKFFETYFRPFPDLFYKVLKVASDPVFNISVDGLSNTEPKM